MIETADGIGNKNEPHNKKSEEDHEKRLKVMHLVVRCLCACGFTLQSLLTLRLAAVQSMCASQIEFQLALAVRDYRRIEFQLALACHDFFRGSRCCNRSRAQIHADICGQLHKPQVNVAALRKAASGTQASPEVDGSNYQRSSQET